MCVCVQVSVSVMWVTDPGTPVPGWVVALAVLAGLLLLALLIFIMYKVRTQPGFYFERELILQTL